MLPVPVTAVICVPVDNPPPVSGAPISGKVASWNGIIVAPLNPPIGQIKFPFAPLDATLNVGLPIVAPE